MRRYVLLVFLIVAIDAPARDTLRVGSQVLVTGDSAARVRALLGKPMPISGGHKASRSQRKGNSKTKAKSKTRGRTADSASEKGEQWQYRLDGHTTIITIVNGKVTRIEDSYS